MSNDNSSGRPSADALLLAGEVLRLDGTFPSVDLSADEYKAAMRGRRAAIHDAAVKLALAVKASEATVGHALRGAVATGGVAAIAEERARQMAKEGWTPEHDDSHAHGELAQAAACYAVHHTDARVISPDDNSGWPWAHRYWKPGSAVRNLVKAGALIAAEIDRLDRATPKDAPAAEAVTTLGLRGDAAEGERARGPLAELAAEVLRLDAAAQQGEWTFLHDESGRGHVYGADDFKIHDFFAGTVQGAAANAELIATYRTAAPALAHGWLAAVEMAARAEAERDRTAAEGERLRAELDGARRAKRRWKTIAKKYRSSHYDGLITDDELRTAQAEVERLRAAMARIASDAMRDRIAHLIETTAEIEEREPGNPLLENACDIADAIMDALGTEG